MKVVIAEKPSMGRDIARVLGADRRCDGYCEGNGWQVTWAVGHLVEIHDPLAEGKWAETPLPLYSNFVLRPKKDADRQCRPRSKRNCRLLTDCAAPAPTADESWDCTPRPRTCR